MSSLPPSRYRIVERGRRLVTIDTRTGAEIGLGATLANVGLEGYRETMTAAAAAMPKAATHLAIQPTEIPAKSVARTASALSPARVSSTPASQTHTSPVLPTVHPRPMSGLTPQNKPKVIALLVAAFIAVVLLLATGTWPIPVILMLIPQTRQWILSLAGSAVRRVLDQDANG